jgi:hypothetical protein
MSEYQYYEFITVDRPLTREQMAELRSISGRAKISPTRFTNEYNYGDFRGDLDRMMTRYFDVMLYYANFGLRRVMLRLPKEAIAPKLLASFGGKRSFRVKPKDDVVVLDFEASLEESDDEYWQLEQSELMAELAPVRAELLGGDLRAFYLGWLLSAQQDDLKDNAVEPPIPPGLGALSSPLRRLAEFLWIDEELLTLAAEESTPLPPESGGLKAWLAALPAAEKDPLLFSLLTQEDVGLRARLLRRSRDSRPGADPTPGKRTVKALLEAASARRAAREREEEERAAEEEARRKKKEQADKKRRLKTLATRKEAAWKDTERLVSLKEKKSYEEAVSLLKDLYELSLEEGEEQAFLHKLADLRDRHRSKQAFIHQLVKEGINFRRPHRT